MSGFGLAQQRLNVDQSATVTPHYMATKLNQPAMMMELRQLAIRACVATQHARLTIFVTALSVVQSA